MEDGAASPTAATVNVTVKFKGRSIPLSVSADATIADLKSLLQPLTDVLPRGQRLISKGKILMDSSTLRSSDVTNGAKIMLMASQGLHQGGGPVIKEASCSPKLRVAHATRKMGGAVDVAVEKSRTERWKATGVVALSECNLKSIPDEVWSCGPSARVLDLSNNYIRAVPNNVSCLSSMQKLLMNVNELSDDSISWEGLASLKSLNMILLNQNQLTTLPPALGALVSLRQLHIANNQLTRLPAELGLLNNLEILNVSNNRLSAIPESIGDCGSLIEVDISSNLLKELPQAFGNLKKLKALHLNNNGINSLPPCLFRTCADLSTLNLHGTEITIDFLRQCEGWEDFDRRRRSKHQKQLDFRIGSSAEFDEGADKR